MPRTALPKPEQVPADSKPTLDMFTKNIGFTPNMMATFALSPIAFNSWATLLGSLSKALDVKTRDSIGLAGLIFLVSRARARVRLKKLGLTWRPCRTRSSRPELAPLHDGKGEALVHKDRPWSTHTTARILYADSA
jgi:hypothetical protein